MLPYEVIWPTVIVLGGLKNIMAVMSKRLYYNKIHRSDGIFHNIFLFLGVTTFTAYYFFTKAASKRKGSVNDVSEPNRFTEKAWE